MFHDNLEMLLAHYQPRSARRIYAGRSTGNLQFGDQTVTVELQLLRHFLEIVTLDDVANFVFGKVA
jgi:hypothetical protein